MNATGLNHQREQALMDLLVLGMYSDGHLASAEDARVQQLLDAIPLSSEHTRRAFVDASFARVREHMAPGSQSALIRKIAGLFPDQDERRRVCESLEELLRSDDRVTESERRFLGEVRQLFGI